MQVYVELALLENFCMDFTLLYCAKLVCKNRASFWRVAFAAAIGACFAVVFPLFKLKGVWAVTVKLIYMPPIYYEEYKNMKTVDIAAEVKRRIENTIDEYMQENIL